MNQIWHLKHNTRIITNIFKKRVFFNVCFWKTLYFDVVCTTKNLSLFYYQMSMRMPCHLWKIQTTNHTITNLHYNSNRGAVANVSNPKNNSEVVNGRIGVRPSNFNINLIKPSVYAKKCFGKCDPKGLSLPESKTPYFRFSVWHLADVTSSFRSYDSSLQEADDHK